MLKIILKTFFGLLVSALGFCLGFYYLVEMEEGATPLLLLPAVFLIVLGAYFLMRAGKSDVTIVKKPDLSEKDMAKEGLEEIFDKNIQISSKWAKTVENRDKLKLLEISSAGEDQE